MKRIVSVWLPLWPIERLRRATPSAVPDDAPLALVESGTHGIRISAVSARAAREGVRIGQALADARAMLPALLSRPAEPHHDRIALLKLARWCGRYGPARHADGSDGLWIDITGVAHLYGGEERLLQDLHARLSRFGLTARAGLADTLGAAHALARFETSATAIAPIAKTEAYISRLPVEALRLEAGVVLLLKRLGLKRIGQLYALPRATLERRFRSKDAAAAVLSRLDQALGLTPEPRRALAEPPALFVQRAFADPLISAEGLEAETSSLAQELCVTLEGRSLGARAIALSLYRADGTTAEARAGLSFACCTPEHLLALLSEKLSTLDAGFGVDLLVLSAVRVEPRTAQQTALSARSEAGADPARLVDRLSNRLGQDRVSRLAPRESHIPERAEARIPALQNFARAKPPSWPPQRGPARPAFLLSTPEPIGVMAEVPDGPPARFTWRRVKHRVVRAHGPERIAPEWWREIGADGARISHTRDYYRLEDETGAGYWVFREGLYGREEEETPTWFLHGLFG